MIPYLLRYFIFAFIFRPLVWLILGLQVRHFHRLPLQGPAILVANHNSHLDTIVLMMLYPQKTISRVRPVAAADYFFKNRYLKWFCETILQVIPIHRSPDRKNLENPLSGVSEALQQGQIVIYYPEGTRGEPEQIGKFKNGIMHLAKSHPTVPIIPIHLFGLGKALPKGKPLFVPFTAQAVIGEPLFFSKNNNAFISELREHLISLGKEAI